MIMACCMKGRVSRSTVTSPASCGLLTVAAATGVPGVSISLRDNDAGGVIMQSASSKPSQSLNSNTASREPRNQTKLPILPPPKTGLSHHLMAEYWRATQAHQLILPIRDCIPKLAIAIHRSQWTSRLTQVQMSLCTIQCQACLIASKIDLLISCQSLHPFRASGESAIRRSKIRLANMALQTARILLVPGALHPYCALC